eukprot:8853-Pelagomonas_calceolata.AAC.3
MSTWWWAAWTARCTPGTCAREFLTNALGSHFELKMRKNYVGRETHPLHLLGRGATLEQVLLGWGWQIPYMCTMNCAFSLPRS